MADYNSSYTGVQIDTAVGNALNPDAAPTSGSNQLVKSGGVYSALQNSVPVYGMGDNLLDNWYFVGGGTGRGVFPINQRGATSISTSSGYPYFIDRWYAYKGSSGTGYASLDSTGVYIYRASGGSSYAYLAQLLPTATYNFLDGKKCTVSVFLSDGFLYSKTATITAGTNTSFGSESVGSYSLNLYLSSAGALQIRSYADSSNVVSIKAVKLELGTQQTLCHNEGTEANPVWVLNDVPNYEDELNKCIIQPIEGSSSGVDTYANKNFATTQQLAPIETGLTASQNYTVGDLICWNNLLYKASSAIASGDTLAVGTNLTATTIEDEIEAVNTLAAAAVPQTRTINGKALSSDISLTPTDVGALAVDGTAVSASTLASQYTCGAVVGGWYQFLTLNISSGSDSRKIILLIEDGYTSTSGILSIYYNRTTSGFSHGVYWLTTNMNVSDVRFIANTSDAENNSIVFYIRKRSNENGRMTFRVLSSMARRGTPYSISNAEWSFTSVSEPTTASTPSVNINNNAATATNATNDGNGNQIDTTYVPQTRTVNGKALSSDITLSASDVSAVPTTRTVNNKALSSDITLTASDVSAVPTSRKVNNKALSSDITLTASDVGALASANALSELYGECSSPAADQQKEVSIPSITSLTAGIHITVRFTKIQSYDGAPTLKVNSLDAKTIYRANSNTAELNEWYAGAVLDFVYNGTAWVIVNKGHATTTYWGQTKLSSAVNSTSTSLAATPSAVKQAYDLANGRQPAIKSGTISFPLSWSGTTTFTETVTVSGVTITASSKINLQPTAAQLAQLISDGVSAMTIENNSGTLTAYSLGAAPTTAMTIACTVTEVSS